MRSTTNGVRTDILKFSAGFIVKYSKCEFNTTEWKTRAQSLAPRWCEAIVGKEKQEAQEINLVAGRDLMAVPQVSRPPREPCSRPIESVAG
jgi:hypothetical protein